VAADGDGGVRGADGRVFGWAVMATIYDLDELVLKVRAQGLTLATLCDLVLGEDATNRSDEALIRAVGELKRQHQEMKSLKNILERTNDES